MPYSAYISWWNRQTPQRIALRIGDPLLNVDEEELQLFRVSISVRLRFPSSKLLHRLRLNFVFDAYNNIIELI
jgi:hypothetical protein